MQQCDKYPLAIHSSSSSSSYRQQQQPKGQRFECVDGDCSGVHGGGGSPHPLAYATIACVRKDGRHSRRPPRRQNSSETILPPPPSFYSADHPLIVSYFLQTLNDIPITILSAYSIDQTSNCGSTEIYNVPLSKKKEVIENYQEIVSFLETSNTRTYVLHLLLQFSFYRMITNLQKKNEIKIMAMLEQIKVVL